MSKATIVGTCQICGRPIGAKSGIIAAHGYTQPRYHGWRSGGCAGAGYLPYEKSCERLREMIISLKAFIVKQEGLLAEHMVGPQVLKVIEGREPRTREVTYEKPSDFNVNVKYYGMPHTYGNAFCSRRDDYQNTIRYATEDVAVMERRVLAWEEAHAADGKEA